MQIDRDIFIKYIQKLLYKFYKEKQNLILSTDNIGDIFIDIDCDCICCDIIFLNQNSTFYTSLNKWLTFNRKQKLIKLLNDNK